MWGVVVGDLHEEGKLKWLVKVVDQLTTQSPSSVFLCPQVLVFVNENIWLLFVSKLKGVFFFFLCFLNKNIKLMFF